MIKGISHITFAVKDLTRTSALFKKVFDAAEVHSTHQAKYFLINNLWVALNAGEPSPHRTYNHIAFQIEDSDFDKYMTLIKEAGAEIKPDRPRKTGEGRSIYFYDFDNNLFELHTGTLSERLNQ